MKREQYTFDKIYNPISPHGFYEIQGKKFMCGDYSLIKEDFNVNGPAMLLREYFNSVTGGKYKMINWARMRLMDKRGEKDEYVKSKFKGMEKPKKVKVSRFDFIKC